MRSLLRKEWLLLRSQKMMFPLFVLFGVFSGVTATTGAWVSMMLPMFVVFYLSTASLTMEYKYQGDRAMSALPVHRSEMVKAKYLFIALSTLSILALEILAMGLYDILVAMLGDFPTRAWEKLGVTYDPFPLGLIILSAIPAIIWVSFNFASYFVFGYLKSRYVNVWAFMAITIGFTTYKSVTDSKSSLGPETLALFKQPLAVGLAVTAALALFGISCILSMRFFSKRDLGNA